MRLRSFDERVLCAYAQDAGVTCRHRGGDVTRFTGKEGISRDEICVYERVVHNGLMNPTS
jgi:hypothetical protein